MEVPRQSRARLLGGDRRRFAGFAHENHKELGRSVALVEELMLVIERLDVSFACLVRVRLSAFTLQLDFPFENVNVRRHRMLMQGCSATRLNSADDGNDLG